MGQSRLQQRIFPWPILVLLISKDGIIEKFLPPWTITLKGMIWWLSYGLTKLVVILLATVKEHLKWNQYIGLVGAKSMKNIMLSLTMLRWRYPRTRRSKHNIMYKLRLIVTTGNVNMTWNYSGFSRL